MQRVSKAEGLTPFVVDNNNSALYIIDIIIGILESIVHNRTFTGASGYVDVVYKDIGGSYHVDESHTNPRNLRRLVLRITKTARQNAVQSILSGLDTDQIVSLIISENTLEEMLGVAQSLCHQLESALVHRCKEKEEYGYGPLSDMTLEEFTGSRYDPEC